MADNTKGRSDIGSITWYLPVSAGVVSADPVEIVDLHGTAITDRDSDGYATVELSGINEVRDFNVEAVNNSGNIAVAVGDLLYYDTAATIKINKDNTNGKKFGYALETITSGSSAVIAVAVQN